MTLRETIDLAAGQIDKSFPDDPLIQATIRLSLGDSYSGMGLWEQATVQFENAYQLRRNALGPDAPETLFAMQQLANQYNVSSDYKSAERLLVDLIAADRRTGGDNSPGTFTAIASLIVPSIVTSLGIALLFRLIDAAVKAGPAWMSDTYTTGAGLFTSGLAAHLTWTLPFGLLIMFAIFNRFDGRLEEAARDLGATPWKSFRHVVLPLILPALIGVALFGFTLSWDEIARSSQAIGSDNTLPLQLQALTTTVTTPMIYALGTTTTGVSFVVIALALLGIALARSRQNRHGSDAGKA